MDACGVGRGEGTPPATRMRRRKTRQQPHDRTDEGTTSLSFNRRNTNQQRPGAIKGLLVLNVHDATYRLEPTVVMVFAASADSRDDA